MSPALKNRNLALALCVKSVEPERMIMSASAEQFCSDVVNGTVAYVGGSVGELTWQHYHDLARHSQDGMIAYLQDMEAYYHTTDELFRKRLPTRINESLSKMLKVRKASADNGLIQVFRDAGGIKDMSTPQGISIVLNPGLAETVEERILPGYNPAERVAVVGIGKKMKMLVQARREGISESRVR